MTWLQHLGQAPVCFFFFYCYVDHRDLHSFPTRRSSDLSLGFGRQGGIAPFPPTRPMFTGTVDHGGAPYRVHLHVMPPARGELAELVALRDALRADPDLCRQYAEAKRRIVGEAADGQSTELYTARKADFVLDALYR